MALFLHASFHFVYSQLKQLCRKQKEADSSWNTREDLPVHLSVWWLKTFRKYTAPVLATRSTYPDDEIVP
jgi:hypothetical protein